MFFAWKGKKVLDGQNSLTMVNWLKTQKVLKNCVGVFQATISKYLKLAGYVQKQGNR